MNTKKLGLIISIVAAVIAVATAAIVLWPQSRPDGHTTITPTVSTSTPTAKAANPYDYYLKHNPDPSLVLSREDAQTRAMLGCGQKWAPGTIDAVLAQAYADLCTG